MKTFEKYKGSAKPESAEMFLTDVTPCNSVKDYYPTEEQMGDYKKIVKK